MKEAFFVVGLLVGTVLSSGLACGHDQFRCSSGQCVPLRFKCNGENDCSDSSDESPTQCAMPTITMVEGDVVHVRAQCKPEHIDVVLMLCQGGSKCNRLAVFVDPGNSGRLQYYYHTRCNEQGNGCSTIIHKPSSNKNCNEVMELVLERRPLQLAVWLKGHPSQKVTAPITAGDLTLSVRPGFWKSDMDINMTGSCVCTCRTDRPKGRLLADGSCLIMKGAAVTRVKPAERVTQPHKCGVSLKECVSSCAIPSFGAEYSNSSGTETEAWEPSLSKEFSNFMTKEATRGWSEQTSASSTFLCHILPGHTGWLEITPEYYIKEGTICNKNCFDIAKWFPKTAADGSIAGERECRVNDKPN